MPGGSRVKGRAYHLDGAVKKITGTPWTADAIVRGARPYVVDIHRDPSGAFTASCDCPYFHDRFVICKHIWAALLEAERRGYLAGDGGLPDTAVLTPGDRGEASDPEYATPAEIANGAPGSGNQFEVPSQKSWADRGTAAIATAIAQPSQKDAALMFISLTIS